jgi:hypothetical protein
MQKLWQDYKVQCHLLSFVFEGMLWLAGENFNYFSDKTV